MESFSRDSGILTVEEGTEILQAETYAERQDIFGLILPGSLRELGGAAFAGCTNLRSVRFSASPRLEQLCDGAFTLCHALASFPFPDTLRSIGEMVFWETGLRTVTLPSSVEEVGDSAFWACRNLSVFNVENPLCRLGNDVLGDCPSLQKGFVAPGFPVSRYYNQADELVYALLWLSCPDRHGRETSERAASFVREQLQIVMETILDRNLTAAMTGLSEHGFLKGLPVDGYLERAEEKGLREITNLLLETRRDTAGNAVFEDLEL